jgi:hypothetical protein
LTRRGLTGNLEREGCAAEPSEVESPPLDCILEIVLPRAGRKVRSIVVGERTGEGWVTSAKSATTRGVHFRQTWESEFDITCGYLRNAVIQHDDIHQEGVKKL